MPNGDNKAANSGKPGVNDAPGVSGEHGSSGESGAANIDKPVNPLKVEAKEKLKLDDGVKKAANESVSGFDKKLQTPGALEVEEMPESGELQERRKKTKSLLQETVPEDEDFERAFGDDEGGFADLLREANLSPRHFRFCCGGIFLVFFLAALVWGGINLVPKVFDMFGGDEVVLDDGEIDEMDGEDGNDDGDETGLSDENGNNGGFDYEGFEEEYGFLDPSIYIGVLIGEEVSENDEATGAGEELGEELIAGDSLALAIRDFAFMYETMQVDVQQLLDASNDRQETLDDYQHELNYLLYVGSQTFEELKQANEYITLKFTEIEGERDINELRFFDKMRELDAYGSSAALNDFIADAEEVVNLRAQYQARLKLISYYENVIVSMEARLLDIELNEEALVKGIQVVDISGSDIDLIIEESEL